MLAYLLYLSFVSVKDNESDPYSSAGETVGDRLRKIGYVGWVDARDTRNILRIIAFVLMFTVLYCFFMEHGPITTRYMFNTAARSG
jgi:hypothetical protein